MVKKKQDKKLTVRFFPGLHDYLIEKKCRCSPFGDALGFGNGGVFY